MLLGAKNLEEYITLHQRDSIEWLTDKLLLNVTNPILRSECWQNVAAIIALLPQPAAREEYIKKISKPNGLSWQTLAKMVDDALKVHKKKEAKTKKENVAVKKNKIAKLESDPKTWPFFKEIAKEDKATGESVFTGIVIDKLKFVQLLSSFGFSRYGTGVQGDYNFVKLESNIIKSVDRNYIIDYIEDFIKKEYDFDAAGYEHVDASLLLNKMYDNMGRLFSNDMFARARTEEPIIVNRDTATETFFYYQNGFVRINKEGYQLLPYDNMQGSVWEGQIMKRDFAILDTNVTPNEMGNFADFVWKIAGENAERFQALCSIIGYLTHDFYEYKLKAVLFTDSTLAESSEGRTGKTLLAKMIGHVRSYAEINGKDFNTGDVNRYAMVTMETQIVHINDVANRGRNAFNFEDVFNDITEGFIVNGKYLKPYRHWSKILLSSNKSLNITGASQRDRIIEFEMSDYWNEERSPAAYYNQWFGRDWDETEWHKFDNFMCFCSQLFHVHGLLQPTIINLNTRKLMDHVGTEFLDFMDDIEKSVIESGTPWTGYIFRLNESPCKDFYQFEFDSKQLLNKFLENNSDKRSWLNQKRFNQWIVKFSELELKIKRPRYFRSNGIGYYQFVETPKG
jgi:hypothetical protein